LEEVFRNTARTIENEQPRTWEDAERCLRPFYSNYAREVFDQSAKANLLSRSNRQRDSFPSWLKTELLPAVVEDVCAIDGVVEIALRHAANLIADERPRDTYNALWRILSSEMEPKSFLVRLRDRLARELAARSLYWEGQPTSPAKSKKRKKSRPARPGGEKKVARREKREPHPDPESVLAGKDRVTVETAAELLGVTPRRVRQLVLEEHLDTLGIGHAKRISAQSIRQRLNLPTNLEENGNSRKSATYPKT
jgi:hypothetical protein